MSYSRGTRIEEHYESIVLRFASYNVSFLHSFWCLHTMDDLKKKFLFKIPTAAEVKNMIKISE